MPVEILFVLIFTFCLLILILLRERYNADSDLEKEIITVIQFLGILIILGTSWFFIVQKKYDWVELESKTFYKIKIIDGEPYLRTDKKIIKIYDTEYGWTEKGTIMGEHPNHKWKENQVVKLIEYQKWYGGLYYNAAPKMVLQKD